jgi:filamentous hemagglutinin
MKARGFVGTRDATVQAFRALPQEQQIPFLTRVLFAELRTQGRAAVAVGDGDFSAGYAALKTLFPDIDPAKMHTGDLSLFFSRIYTLDGGDIQALAPGGIVNVGLATPPAAFGVKKSPSELGIVAQGTGNVNVLSGGDILVNQSRVFVADGGSIMMWSSDGNIDAGRGAKTSISAPAPVITYDTNGNATVQFPAALTGSGIRAFVTSPGRAPGDVDLYAPTGIILVNDAGIGSAGNITIGATQVVGVGNIDVGGVAVGLPVDTAGLGAGLTGASSSASGASSSVTGDAAAAAGEQKTALADSALSWLDVFVVGLGEDQCDQKDLECLKRQRKQP